MKKYCLVTDGKIVRGPEILPPTYVNVQANVRVSGFNNLPDATLLTYGWMPVLVEEVGRTEYSTLCETKFLVADEVVTQVDTYSQLTKEEFEQQRNAILELTEQKRLISESADW